MAVTFDAIARGYQSDVLVQSKPQLPDHGVPENDVFERISAQEFAAFHSLCVSAADLARRALAAPTVVESASIWRELLGPEFPEPPTGTFAARAAASTIATPGRFG